MRSHDPLMQPGAYRSFAIDSPRDLTVIAACRQVNCGAWRRGWRSIVDEATDLGRMRAAWIRYRSRRTFTESRTGPPGAQLTVFTFDPWQRCFTEHRTRPESYFTFPGDRRAQVGPMYVHTRPVDWVEDCAENQLRLIDQIQRG